MKLLYHIRKNMVCLTKMYCYSYERVSLFTSLLKVSFGKKQHKKHLPLLFLIFHWLIRSFQQKVFSFSFHLCFSIFLTVIKMIFAEVVSKKVCCPVILFSLLPYFGRFPLCKRCPYSEFFWSAFGLNLEIYWANLCIQSKCEKIWTRKTRNTVTFTQCSPDFNPPI